MIHSILLILVAAIVVGGPRPPQDEFVDEIQRLIDQDLLGSSDAEQWALTALEAIANHRTTDAIEFLERVYSSILKTNVSERTRCMIAAEVAVLLASTGQYGRASWSERGVSVSGGAVGEFHTAVRHLDGDADVQNALLGGGAAASPVIYLYNRLLMHHDESFAEAFVPYEVSTMGNRPLGVARSLYARWEAKTASLYDIDPQAWSRSMRRWIAIIELVSR